MIHANTKTFANALVNAVILLDENLCIQWYNSAAKKLLALDNDALTKTITESIPDKTFDNYLRQFLSPQDPKKQALSDKLLANENTLELPAPHNRAITLSVCLKPYVNNQWLLIVQDVTQIHHLEKMRRDFIANVSHELRTPLTVIKGYLETMSDHYQNSTQSWTPMLNQMQQQAKRMENLIADLLLLSRLEIDNPDMGKQEVIHLKYILEAIRADAIALSGHRKHHITLSVTDDHKIFGNPEELHSAFSNLVFNAVHYTPDGGDIHIMTHKKNNKLYVNVKDTGIGIKAKHIPRITERFYRVERGRSRERGGTGLGLAIVKHVLLRHKASLQIESEVGKGSCFSCVFEINP